MYKADSANALVYHPHARTLSLTHLLQIQTQAVQDYRWL